MSQQLPPPVHRREQESGLTGRNMEPPRSLWRARRAKASNSSNESRMKECSDRGSDAMS